MSDKESKMRKDFDQVADSQRSSRFSMKNIDPHIAKIRTASTLRNKTLIAETEQSAAHHLEKLEALITELRKSPVKESANTALNKETNIQEILDLNLAISELLGHLDYLMTIFSSRYPTREDNKPAASPINFDLMSTNLDAALSKIGQFKQNNPSTPLPPNEPNPFIASPKLTHLMDLVHQNPAILKRATPSIMRDITKTLDDYVKGFIEAMKLGVAMNVHTTAKKIEKATKVTEALKKQREVADSFGLKDPEKIRKTWEELQYFVEHMLAHLYVRMTHLYGPGAASMLSQIEISALIDFYKNLCEEEKQLQRELNGEEIEEAPSSIVERMKSSISGLLSSKKPTKRSSRPPSIVKADIAKNGSQKNFLRNYIKKRREDE